MIEQASSYFDIYFSKFLSERSGFDKEKKEKFRSLLSDLTNAYEAGHSCLVVGPKDQQLLRESHLVSDGEITPLVLHKGRLYLHRYFNYERRLASQMRAMASELFPLQHEEELLDTLFDSNEQDKGERDFQKEAARVALQRSLAIICGGPGTGKTTTVVKILALLLSVNQADLRIGLAAPTGKAAMRLQQSIVSSLQFLDIPEEIKEAIPIQAQTLHRLLGVRRGSPQFRHNGKNPMGWDVVVVDEASMVDLAMMSKLVDGLKAGAKLLLLGDKDQLASVESGAVLGDLIQSLPANSVELRKTYRFESEIKSLAENIKNGQAVQAWNNLTEKKSGKVRLLQKELVNYIADKYQPFMEGIGRYPELDVRELLTRFNSFQVLCGVYYGDRGVEGLNGRVERCFARRGFSCRTDNWYAGRPVMVTSNDYNLELFNGDIGICLPDEKENSLKVWFEKPDGTFRSYSPYRLPSCQTVFAMTIHKSQGSEFQEVVVVFPEEDQRVLSRELIYTAITRAKKSVTIVAEQDVFSQALSRKVERFSGLSDQLVEQP